MVVRPAPLLLAAGLLFWGWFSGFVAVALVLAAVLEAPRYVRVRWELSARDFERIADLCTIAFVAALAFQFLQSRHFPDSLISALVWLPMLFFALILAQRYSTAQRIPLSALFWSLRQRTRARIGDRRAQQAIRLDYAFFSLCLLAACAANPRTPWFLACLCALCVYALWPAAPQRRSRRTWALVLAFGLAVGFAAQAGLLRAQAGLEELVFDWLSHRWRSPSDAYQSHTAIGDLGELKASDRIVARVDAGRDPPPQRLRLATYVVYSAATWTAPGQSFMPVTGASQTWAFGSGRGTGVRLSAWLEHERPLLALPLGTFRVDSLNVSSVQRNSLGAVRVEDGPDLLLFAAQFDLSSSLDAPPDAVDLTLPSSLRPTLQKVADEIGLTDGAHDPRAAAAAIETFFDSHFAYTLVLSGRDATSRSLSQFLLADRRGHCEYFATATVLLLRQAGIPARYATGYAVQEWSPLERQYVVRKRHAHAWALAWIDGRWRELDTTPAVWTAEERDAASVLEPLYDVLSLVYYRLSLWQYAPGDGVNPGVIMLCVAAALTLYLVWRIWRRHRVRVPAATPVDPAATPYARNSRIVALLQALGALGYARPAGTPLLRWVRELPLADEQSRRLLEDIVRNYYFLRFDPLGSTRERRELLDQRVAMLLPRLASSWMRPRNDAAS